MKNLRNFHQYLIDISVVSKAIFKTTVILLLAITISSCNNDPGADQEICSNGIDDDLDGFIDSEDFDKFKTEMSRNKILVAGGWPSKKHWGRVTVGTEQEMAVFFKAISG